MASAILEKRELYIDVEIKEEQLEEIFLYQVDFLRDKTFRTREFFYKKEEEEVLQIVTDGEEAEEQPLPPEPIELFRVQWELFCQEEIPTEVYATDAMKVMDYLFEPLMRTYPDFKAAPSIRAGREFIHDCVSMGRVVSMSVFDEEQYLFAAIRRRMKERYHEYVDEIKAERKEHIFIRQTVSEEELPVLLLSIVDSSYTLKKQVMLNRGIKEETMAVRLREILSLYPDADVIVDTSTPELYRLFHNMNQFMSMENKRLLFSMESMLTALGKTPEETDLIKIYLLYIKNLEEIRLGTFIPDRLYSVHSFYLPVQISSEKAWKRQFTKNTVWKQETKDCYHIMAVGELKGKYVVRAGKEQFIMRLRKISVQRYLNDYAVLRLDLENYCYPGKADKLRINELASCLYVGGNERVDAMELKLKDGKQAYALSAVPVEGNESQLWLNGLLQLGRKKKKKQDKKALIMTAMKDSMYCVENQESPEEEKLIQNVLIRDGVYREIEDALAKAVEPEKKDRPMGSLLKRQERAVKTLFDKYRYIVVAFGEGYEAAQSEVQNRLWKTTEQALGTTEVNERLSRKFGLFF